MKYGFIGCGNMGGALATAAAKTVGGASLLLADADVHKAKSLAERLGAQVATNEEIAQTCDYIVLGVKPQMMGAVLKALPIEGAPIMVSMAAGLSIKTLKDMCERALPWIRMMPNMPVAVGEGTILYTAEADDTAVEGFCTLFDKAGKLFAMEEKLIDAGSALSGCGPAFAFLFIEALADGAVKCGMPRAQAEQLAANTLLGSAKMALESDLHPGALKDAVCSPGGSTIAGVAALERYAFRAATIEAVEAAYERTKELGNK